MLTAIHMGNSVQAANYAREAIHLAGKLNKEN
jgi:hypothetical protein